MSDFPAKVLIFEEGPREAFQSEKKPISTDQKVRMIDALSGTGLHHIQTVSFVDPRRVPGMADAENVARHIQKAPGVEYSALWMNERGLRQALTVPGLTVDGKIRLYASDAFLASNLARTPEDNAEKNQGVMALCRELGVDVTHVSIGAAFGCNFQGDVPVSRVVDLAEEAVRVTKGADFAIDHLVLADTMAWATPDRVRRVISEIRSRLPNLKLRLHLHDTRGMGMANAFVALELGVTLFDTSIAGLGGCPFAKHSGASGNLCTEDFVLLCEEMGIDTGIDLAALLEASEIAEDVVGHPVPGHVLKAGSLAEIRSRLKEHA